MQVGCAVSRSRGIACCAFCKTTVLQGAVRTVTAIVSAVWLVVSGDGGPWVCCLLGLEGLRSEASALGFRKLPSHVILYCSMYM